LPDDLRNELDANTLLVGAPAHVGPECIDVGALRDAIRNEHKLSIAYTDRNGNASQRTIWPFALGFFENCRILVCWCELRGDIRHFRTDRIADLAILGARYPRGRRALLKQWRQLQSVSPAIAAAGN